MGKIDGVHTFLVALDETRVSLELSVDYQAGVTVVSEFSAPGQALFDPEEYYEVFGETVVAPGVDHGSQATSWERFVQWCGAAHDIHIVITPKTHQIRFTGPWVLLSL